MSSASGYDCNPQAMQLMSFTQISAVTDVMSPLTLTRCNHQEAVTHLLLMIAIEIVGLLQNLFIQTQVLGFNKVWGV